MKHYLKYFGVISLVKIMAEAILSRKAIKSALVLVCIVLYILAIGLATKAAAQVPFKSHNSLIADNASFKPNDTVKIKRRYDPSGFERYIIVSRGYYGSGGNQIMYDCRDTLNRLWSRLLEKTILKYNKPKK